jgi:hypothetical protein
VVTSIKHPKTGANKMYDEPQLAEKANSIG